MKGSLKGLMFGFTAAEREDAQRLRGDIEFSAHESMGPLGSDCDDGIEHTDAAQGIGVAQKP